MLKLSRDQCMELFEPHKERLYRVAAIPFACSLEMPHIADFTATTMANIRHNLMIRQARIEFRGLRGTRLIDAPYGVTLLEIEEKALIRFKLLDEDGLPSNYPTDRAVEYELCKDLPGIPPAPQRLCFGYRPNKLKTKLNEVLISNTLGKRLLYEIILDIPDEGTIVMPDVSSNTPQQPRPQSRVRIRGSEEQREFGNE